MADSWISCLGGAFILVGFVSLATSIPKAGDRTTREYWLSWAPISGTLVAFVLMFAGLGRVVFVFYGWLALLMIAFYVGRALINQAHADLRPDSSSQRQTAYTVAVVGVVLAVVTALGHSLGVSWQEFIETR